MADVPWFPPGLKDSMRRYNWAASHIAKLNDMLINFNNSRSWEPEKSADLAPEMVRIRIHREPPPEIGLVLGDAVHSLRASLDYATCALVGIADADADLRKVQFPFGRSGFPLNSAERAPLKVIGDIALPHIEEARRLGVPYLDVLNRLSNQDKHRLIASVMHRRMPMKVKFDRGANTADIVPDPDQEHVWMQPLADGDVLDMGNMLALRPGFQIEGDPGPYSLRVIGQMFTVTRIALGLMAMAAEAMLTMKGQSPAA